MSLVTGIHKYFELSAWERRVFHRALVRLPVVDIALRLFGLQRTQGLLGRRQAGGAAVGARGVEVDPQRVAQLVQSASARGPYRWARCLPQSLVTRVLLAEVGLEGSLRIGVQKNGQSMQAHAWVEVDGVPLAQSPQLYEEFAVMGEEGVGRDPSGFVLVDHRKSSGHENGNRRYRPGGRSAQAEGSR